MFQKNKMINVFNDFFIELLGVSADLTFVEVDRNACSTAFQITLSCVANTAGNLQIYSPTQKITDNCELQENADPDVFEIKSCSINEKIEIAFNADVVHDGSWECIYNFGSVIKRLDVNTGGYEIIKLLNTSKLFNEHEYPLPRSPEYVSKLGPKHVWTCLDIIDMPRHVFAKNSFSLFLISRQVRVLTVQSTHYTVHSTLCQLHSTQYRASGFPVF